MKILTVTAQNGYHELLLFPQRFMKLAIKIAIWVLLMIIMRFHFLDWHLHARSPPILPFALYTLHNILTSADKIDLSPIPHYPSFGIRANCRKLPTLSHEEILCRVLFSKCIKEIT